MKKQRERIRLATITLLIFGFLVVAGGCERNEHNVHNRVSSVADPIVQASEVFEGYSETKTEVIEVKYIVPADTPEGIIREIFGTHADKAMRLLTDPECAENRTLNPIAVNDNTTWGGVGQDRGMFQISNYYHPIDDECAFDARCNTQYAWKLYKENGFRFNLWTCGRVLGL